MNRTPENESEHCSSLPIDDVNDANKESEASQVEAEEEMPDEISQEISYTPEENETDDSPQKETVPFFRIAFEYLELFVSSLCIVFFVFMFGVRLCNVRGSSMENTLYEKERLLTLDLFYEPERGDIIVFHQTGDYLNEPVVKRVIATGGETVSLEYRPNPQTIVVTVYRDEEMLQVLDESEYAYYDGTHVAEYNRQEKVVYHVPEGYLFVLGDNRNNSADSRSQAIGLVDERRVLGKVVTRVFPFSRFGAVD